MKFARRPIMLTLEGDLEGVTAPRRGFAAGRSWLDHMCHGQVLLNANATTKKCKKAITEMSERKGYPEKV